MLKFGNKEFRNLQEQVLENMKDIANLQEGTAVLDEFGIKVVGEVDALADLPTVLEYKSEHEDWAYGDAYAVGTESPYTLYILTRANDTIDEDHWFDIGVFPAPGPQGEQGPKGDQGIQGPTGPSGEDGLDAGFGSITATAETLSSGSPATASVTVSGPNTAKELAFTFGIPQNTPAGFTHYITITPNGATSGTLGQSEYNILYDNYDSIIRLRVGSQTINYYFLKKWSVTDDYMRYICLWSVNNTDTRYYLITIDRSNRNWTLASGEPFKVSQYNINSGSATNGQVLTADGNGGASWEDAGSGSGLEVVTLTQSTSTLSDDDYNKLNGDNAIIKFVSSADGWTKYFKKYKDDGTYIYYYQVSQEDGRGTFFGGFRIVKSTKYCASLNSYLAVTSSNIKSGSTIANQYLTSNGSGGTSWTSGPSFTQVQSDWNESSSSSPAFIKNKPSLFSGDYEDLTNKPDLSVYAESADLATVATTGDYDDLLNKPTIPTVDYPVTDVQVNGTSVVSNKVASITVPTNYVTLDTAQTITNTKTFKQGISSYLLFQDSSSVVVGALQYNWHHGNSYLELQGSYVGLNSPNILLSPNTDGYGLKVPSTTSYTGNKTIATTDQIPVVPTNISSFTNDSGYITGINSSDVTTALGYTPLANTACTYQTTAPTAAATDGGVHIVYLSAEPATKYSGYIYMIAEA